MSFFGIQSKARSCMGLLEKEGSYQGNILAAASLKILIFFPLDQFPKALHEER
jgi:hypothetical protein